MFSIGDFARHGRVSVRMLRHYDALGLLPRRRDRRIRTSARLTHGVMDAGSAAW